MARMQHLSMDQLKALLLHVQDGKSMPAWRLRLAILVTFLHGLRVTETVSLTGASIRDSYVRVKRLKGSDETVQPFVKHPDPDLDEFKGLTELAATVGAKERLFPITRFGFYRMIQRAGARAGLPKHLLHPHALKHSIAMHTIKDAGIEHVRRHLGHKSIASTGEYLKVTDEQASAAILLALGAGAGK